MVVRQPPQVFAPEVGARVARPGDGVVASAELRGHHGRAHPGPPLSRRCRMEDRAVGLGEGGVEGSAPFHLAGDHVDGERSEEHTSELQSLMRCTYAVFCLNHKTAEMHYTRSHSNKGTNKQYVTCS